MELKWVKLVTTKRKCRICDIIKLNELTLTQLKRISVTYESNMRQWMYDRWWLAGTEVEICNRQGT